MSKTSAQQKHARSRAMQRFGINLTPAKQAAIVRMIQTGRAEKVDRQSHRVTRWLVTIDGDRMFVVYDKQRKTIATVMPPEWAKVGS